MPIDHYVHLMRSALRLHPEDQIPRLERYLEAIGRGDAPPDRDHARVVLVGAFCEQPPVGLLRTIEQAGCDIVDEDLVRRVREARAEGVVFAAPSFCDPALLNRV